MLYDEIAQNSLINQNSFTGQKLLDSLAETWDFFFCDVLSMLQAIFHPVQVADSTTPTTVLIPFLNIFSSIDTFLSEDKITHRQN